MYCICHQVYCVSYHVNQEPHLGVLYLATGVLHRSIIYSTSGASLRVYCISYHVNQEPHLGCTVFANRCTAFAIKCTAYPIIMAVATTETGRVIALFVFVQIMGIPLKKLLGGVILVIFGPFASSDFKVWLRS